MWFFLFLFSFFIDPYLFGARLNDLMESKGGKKKSSSSSLFYEAPLGYSIEDVRPHGGIKKFRSAAYSNCVRKPS
ncbi:S-adenosylmethionine decarboxylase proenzyme [Citrus sinensis]|nr:S-adenosylmethionine decarboxylase proenzyme [Citrus sinensis]